MKIMSRRQNCKLKIMVLRYEFISIKLNPSK